MNFKDIFKDEYIQKTVLALLAVLVIFFAIKTLNEIKSYGYIGAGLDPKSTISVNGEGEVNAVPDLATFNFTVSEEDDSVEEAQNRVGEAVDEILVALKDSGIEEKDIRTQSYNVFPRYEFINREVVCPVGFDCFPPSGERTLVGYEVSQSIELKVRDIEKAGDILSTLGGLEIDNLFGPNFTIEDEDELKSEAREMAIKEAKEKAEKLADQLSVRLGRVVSFNESSPYGFPAYDTAVQEGFGRGSSEGGLKAPLPTGENVIRSNVHIVYELR